MEWGFYSWHLISTWQSFHNPRSFLVAPFIAEDSRSGAKVPSVLSRTDVVDIRPRRSGVVNQGAAMWISLFRRDDKSWMLMVVQHPMKREDLGTYKGTYLHRYEEIPGIRYLITPGSSRQTRLRAVASLMRETSGRPHF